MRPLDPQARAEAHPEALACARRGGPTIVDGETREIIEIPLEVDAGSTGYRLDRFLVRCFGRLSRSRVHRMIERGAVSCARSGRALTKRSMRVHPGLSILVRRPAPVEPAVTLDYRLVHEDASLLVLDKPAGLPVHPSARYHHHTLTALMRARLGADHGWEMAHRLDRETSGLLLFGRRKASGPLLKRAFLRREIAKDYLALVHGHIDAPLVIDRPLGSALGSRVLIKVGERALDDGGVRAITCVEPLAHGHFRGGELSLVRVRPQTGRTHQIRVHLALIGHGVLGDKLYGVDEARFLEVVEGGRAVEDFEAELGLARHALHAWRLRLRHPTSGETVDFEAPWPAALAEILALPSGEALAGAESPSPPGA